MSPSFTVARIAGIRVAVNWSWAIAFALIVWTLESSIFPSDRPGHAHGTYLAMAFVAAVLFFCALLLHELGHALQARRDHVQIEGITLWLFGGVARFKGAFPSAGAELRIAVAGPLVSLAIGALSLLLAWLAPLGAVAGEVAGWLGTINLLLLAFNLLPALPLDGGRVFRSLVWLRTGDFGRATHTAAGAARVVAYGLIGIGLALFVLVGAWGGAWFAFLGWFLLHAALAEERYALLREALGDLRVGDLMVRRPDSIAAEWTLSELMDGIEPLGRHGAYPVLAHGRVVGLLPLAAVARVPRARWGTTRVDACMIRVADVPTVREDEPLLDAVGEIVGRPPERALVRSDGRVVGLLSLSDVGRLVAAHGQRPRRA